MYLFQSTGKAASTSLDNTLASPRLIEKNGDCRDNFEFMVDVTNPPLVSASTAEQGSDDAQNLLDDFGFEFNMCTSATPMMEDGVVLSIASTTDSVDEPLIAPPSVDDVNANSQTLPGRFWIRYQCISFPYKHIVIRCTNNGQLLCTNTF